MSARGSLAPSEMGMRVPLLPGLMGVLNEIRLVMCLLRGPKPGCPVLSLLGTHFPLTLILSVHVAIGVGIEASVNSGAV